LDIKTLAKGHATEGEQPKGTQGMKETVGKRQERMVTGEAAKLKLA
jgi:hypothetical protein